MPSVKSSVCGTKDILHTLDGDDATVHFAFREAFAITIDRSCGRDGTKVNLRRTEANDRAYTESINSHVA